MAASKFGVKLQKSTNKIVVILVYALLEWVLIMLLLLNSMFYFFIKKFATFFGLKPTCLWCSSVASLFDPGTKEGSYEALFCEDHTSQISNLGYCLKHQKLVKIQNRCQDCPNGVANASEDQLGKELICSCCKKSFRSDPPHFMIRKMQDEERCNISNEEPHIISDVEGDSSRSTSNSLCNEDEEEPNQPIISTANHLTAEIEVDGVTEANDSCKSDLKNQELETRFEGGHRNVNETSGNETLDDHPAVDNGNLDIKQLRSELEAERNAAAISANQTMAMITRLQEEKAAIKMEALQYQRMMEEQAEYDQEALQLLNELVIKREKEKLELEKELEVYMRKVLSYGAKKYICSSTSCSLNDDSEKLSIDLTREIEEDGNEIPSTGAVLDSVDLVLDRVKNWNMLDGSMEEFEHERVSILHQLKDLEEKLFSICDDDQARVEEDNANLCSAEVNLEKDHPTTMSSAAKKLLPYLENEDGDNKAAELDQKAIEKERSDKVVAIVKEMDHVYWRLQALEADREFLRHCIGSLNKGDKGVGLLEEILQHLRELRNGDTCGLMLCNE